MDWGKKAGTNGPAAGGVNIINNNTLTAAQSQAPQTSHHLVGSGYEMVGLALRANLAASGTTRTAHGAIPTFPTPLPALPLLTLYVQGPDGRSFEERPVHVLHQGDRLATEYDLIHHISLKRRRPNAVL